MTYRKMFLFLLFSAFAVYCWSYLGVPQEALIAMCLSAGLISMKYVQELEERIDRLERYIQRRDTDMW